MDPFHRRRRTAKTNLNHKHIRYIYVSWKDREQTETYVEVSCWGRARAAGLETKTVRTFPVDIAVCASLAIRANSAASVAASAPEEHTIATWAGLARRRERAAGLGGGENGRREEFRKFFFFLFFFFLLVCFHRSTYYPISPGFRQRNVRKYNSNTFWEKRWNTERNSYPKNSFSPVLLSIVLAAEGDGRDAHSTLNELKGGRSHRADKGESGDRRLRVREHL